MNAREALSFAAWLIVGAYLLASLRTRVPVVGALVVPVTMVLNLAARLSPSKEAAHGVSTLGAVHITLATAGVALFAVAAGGAVIYLIEERALKAHRAGRLFKRGAALETLDTLNRRCIVFGFPLFTVAVITGAVWGVQLHDQLFTPQYSIAAAAWIMYAVLLVARVTAGWRGRRAAIMTIGGFATSLTVLLDLLRARLRRRAALVMARQLGIVGLSHKTAPIEVRERVAFAEDALADALRRLVAVPGVGEAMIVSTCNRVELYAGVDDDGGARGAAALPDRRARAAARACARTSTRTTGNEALAPPVPRRLVARLDGGRRVADPRPGQGGVRRRARRGHARAGAAARGAARVRAGQARAHRDRRRQVVGVDRVGRGRSGGADLRRT